MRTTAHPTAAAGATATGVPPAGMAAAVALVDWVDEILSLEALYADVSPADCFEDGGSAAPAELRRLLREQLLASRGRPQR